MKQLVYNRQIDRYIIKEEGDERELHCGSMFEVLLDEQWITTTIEMQWTNGVGKYYLTTRALSLENIVTDKVPVR